MSNFDLNACGVAEMQQQEMCEVNGGIIGIDDALIVMGVCFLIGLAWGWSSKQA